MSSMCMWPLACKEGEKYPFNISFITLVWTNAEAWCQKTSKSECILGAQSSVKEGLVMQQRRRTYKHACAAQNLLYNSEPSTL